MLTCPCNVEPLTLHMYMVKLGFTGVKIFFQIFALKQRLWVLARTASLRFYDQCFEKKINNFSSEMYHLYSREKSQNIA